MSCPVQENIISSSSNQLKGISNNDIICKAGVLQDEKSIHSPSDKFIGIKEQMPAILQ